MLEGLLIDLVPYSERFIKSEHRWMNSEAVFFWAVGGRWIVSQAQMKEWQRERVEERERSDRRVTFGAQTKDGTPIGLFGISQLDAHHRLAMLTAMIGEVEYWGGGYGTDALLLLVDYAFDWLDMRRVWLMTMSRNPRVMRQMEKVGFALEGRQREATWVGDGWADMLSYGMPREDWPGRAALVEGMGLKAR